jgi:hypothetical protein
VVIVPAVAVCAPRPVTSSSPGWIDFTPGAQASGVIVTSCRPPRPPSWLCCCSSWSAVTGVTWAPGPNASAGSSPADRSSTPSSAPALDPAALDGLLAELLGDAAPSASAPQPARASDPSRPAPTSPDSRRRPHPMIMIMIMIRP